MAQIQVDPKACVKCGACVDVCAGARVYEMGEESSTVVRPTACWACGQCVAVCPTDAIDHEFFPPEDTPIIEPGELPSKDVLVSAFRYRRSVRAYQQKPVPREVIRELVSIGRWAPTATNNQALDWIAFDDRARILGLARATVDGLGRYVKLARNPLIGMFMQLAVGRENTRRLREYAPAIAKMDELVGNGGDPIFHQAPVVLIGHTQKGNLFGRDDAVYAMYNMMLACQRFDLATCQIGFFQSIVERSAKLKKSIGIPEGRVPQVAFSMGYPRHTFRRAPERRKPDLTWNPR